MTFPGMNGYGYLIRDESIVLPHKLVRQPISDMTG